jgi:hypothetical protein
MIVAKSVQCQPVGAFSNQVRVLRVHLDSTLSSISFVFSCSMNSANVAAGEDGRSTQRADVQAVERTINLQIEH